MNNVGVYEGSVCKGKTRWRARPCEACSRLFPACFTASLLRNLQQWDVRLRCGQPVTVAVGRGRGDAERTGFWILDGAMWSLSVAKCDYFTKSASLLDCAFLCEIILRSFIGYLEVVLSFSFEHRVGILLTFINVIKITGEFSFIFTFLAGGWEDKGSIVNRASLSRTKSPSVFFLVCT